MLPRAVEAPGTRWIPNWKVEEWNRAEAGRTASPPGHRRGPEPHRAKEADGLSAQMFS